MQTSTNNKWDWEIRPETSYFSFHFKEFWSYRYLLIGLIRRDFLISYQQTLLGPFWVLLQPIITMTTYVLVFGNVIGVSTGDTPPVLFYLAGIILWTLFNDAFTGTSSSFRDNAHLFSKVYFPRLITPISLVVGNIISFGIQFLFLLLTLAYYQWFTSWQAHLASSWLLFVPVVMLVSAQSLALGLLFSVFTGKYRDVKFVVVLGVRLLMFLTPVIYPLQYVATKWRWLLEINPLTPLFELFRLALLGRGTVTMHQLSYSICFTFMLLAIALFTFNKQVDKLIDVV